MTFTSKETRGGLTIRKLHPMIGAEIHGIDLTGPLASETIEAIRVAWMQHLLLVFPDQPIDDDNHVAFGKRFGDLEIHPSLAHRASHQDAIYRISNLDEEGNFIPPKDTSWQYLSQSWRWHTDSSFREIPSTGSILHGIEITRSGGNTLFANMYAAYDALTDTMKAQVENLWVTHDHDYILNSAPEVSESAERGAFEDLPPVSHPLVRVHPITGKRSLFLSPHTMVKISGQEEAESRALLDQLIEHATSDAFVYRHIWSPDDVIMWDNRCTMHSVEPFDNVTQRRIMHRVTLVGDGPPIPAAGQA
ncbi:MAG: TauD/TfdA family dioxygenase [Rhodospirillaceae bacterium]|nr:TauD/TfdA family dioxygenase [Rhodospirillaceae bacterium]